MPVARTLAELEAQTGQRPVSFKVMYIPNRTQSMLGDDSVRVQPYQDDFVEIYRNMAHSAVFNIVIVIIIFIAASIGLRRASDRRRRQ